MAVSLHYIQDTTKKVLAKKSDHKNVKIFKKDSKKLNFMNSTFPCPICQRTLLFKESLEVHIKIYSFDTVPQFP